MMEETKSSLWKNALNWGVIMGIVTIIYSLLMYFLDLSLEPWVNWASFVFIIGVLIFATITYRDKVLGGTITYGQALGFGVLTILVSVIISAIYSYIFMTIIDPEFVNKLLAMQEEKMIEQGVPAEQIEKGMEMVKKFMQPAVISLISIPSNMFFGLIITLITSAILKKNPAAIQFNEE